MASPIHVQSTSVIPVNADGKILLQQRDDRPDLAYPGCWTTFGGGVEDGETPDEAIHRELLEEIELDLPLALWKVIEIPVEHGGQHFIVEDYVYVGRIDVPAETITLNEGQALGYFALDDLDVLDIGFGYESLFREVFAALVDGSLPL